MPPARTTRVNPMAAKASKATCPRIPKRFPTVKNTGLSTENTMRIRANVPGATSLDA
ncbi:hypothetical protein D3C74_499300 [compost metagenome]